MKYSARQYAEALHQAVLESAAADQEKILDNFVAVLKENGDLVKIDEIEQEFLNFEREARGVEMAQVSTAKPLSKQEEERVVRALNEYVGSAVELKTKIDEGLIGGVVVRIGDELIDGSVRKTLKDLKQQLVK